ncbi:MAG: peptidoglycan DD-metalloendopeptidase family protein [Candidatus Azobacteroides pseudotrichonymphae]|jgi:murein DD-endopeptidase MepM/ murein hydrolase activator NlpD|nr:peptidoglycan DD-metalloendopeptidase family protein [Bacteroidales bacterium OttesenSCG-928-I14]GMO35686.1 MAG: peptidoglycan DD-metalloendopeptidase family protein [Candidatus Azobacteroides pseudotrichonymphae]
MGSLAKVFVIDLYLVGIILFIFPVVEIHARSSSERKLSAGIATPVLSSGLISFQEDGIEQHPAGELYEESWNTEFLKAYENIPVPDSLVIDISSFVIPVEGKVTSPYGFRGKYFHYGTDVKLQVGDTVRAAFEGEVRIRKYDPKGYGYYLVLRHPNGLETVYGHLSQFLVKQNQNVKAGEPIGLGGNTGRSYGSHLHFEIRLLGSAINPAEIIDFDELALKDDIYVYRKGKSGENYIDGSISRYACYRGGGKLRYYRVSSGDTLSAIARKYNTTVDRLCEVNGIKSTGRLHIGDSIRIL